MATADELRAMVYQKAQEKGIANLWPIIDRIIALESGWSPTAHNTRGEDSVGLFQMNRAGGLGAPYATEQLLDPAFNADAALSIIAQRAKAGEGLKSIFRDWTTADRALADAGQGGGTMPNGEQQPTGDITQQVLQWMKNIYPQEGFAEMYFSENPQRWIDFYRQNVLGQAPAAEPPPSYVQAPSPQAQAVTQFDMERALADAQNDIQRFGWEVAAQNFASKITAAQEGRATAEFAQEYARQFAAPGVTTYPGTEPTSPWGQMMQKGGITPPAAVPLPTTNLPRDPYAALAQAQQAVPQPQELAYQPPALPAVPNLAGLSPFPMIGSTGYGGGGGVGYTLPSTAGGEVQYPTQSADVMSGISPGLPLGSSDFALSAETLLQAWNAVMGAVPSAAPTPTPTPGIPYPLWTQTPVPR